MTYVGGDSYNGDWKSGKKHGRGIFTMSYVSSYNGDWKDDKRHGKGTLKYVNGDIYDGDWKSDTRHGKGINKWPNGDSYDGDWKENQRHGKGTFKYVNSGIYHGEWKLGKRHGRGEYTHADSGTVYKGEWMSDRFQGEVKVTDWVLELYSIFTRWFILLRDLEYYIRPVVVTVIYLSLGVGFHDWLFKKKGAGEKKDVVVLTDEHKTCVICFEAFTTDTNSTDETVRRHLPVLSNKCDHWYCHGCILKRQSSLAKKNRDGEVPRRIQCLGSCTTKNAFCPSNPTYHRMLIGLLESSSPIVTEDLDKK